MDLKQCERVDNVQKMATFTLRLLMPLWLVTSVGSVFFTVARHPLCKMSGSSAVLDPTSPMDRGDTCIVNRVGILASVVAM
jgi:hypothetical protein